MTAFLRISHRVSDYDTWRALFNRDPVDRKGSGVRRFRVMRNDDDPQMVTVEHEFDTVEQARDLAAKLYEMLRHEAKGNLSHGRATVLTLIDEVEL